MVLTDRVKGNVPQRYELTALRLAARDRLCVTKNLNRVHTNTCIKLGEKLGHPVGGTPQTFPRRILPDCNQNVSDCSRNCLAIHQSPVTPGAFSPLSFL